MHYPKRWGHLQDRYQDSKPRKMLALDGGGIRGLLTLGILERMEKLLAERQLTLDAMLVQVHGNHRQN